MALNNHQPDSANRTQRAWVAGVISIGLAIGAQYAVQSQQPLLGLIGYGVALLIGLPALRRAVPERVEPDSTPADPLQPSIFAKFSLPKFNFQAPPPSLLSTANAESAAAPVLLPTPTRVVSASPPQPPNFFTHWRYYTISDLLTGRTPDNLPAPVALPTEPSPPPAAPLIESAPPPPAELPDPIPLANATARVTAAPPIATSVMPTAVPEAPVQKWTDFVKPQAVFISPQGYVLVLDAGQNLLLRLDPQGNVNGQWSVPNLPAPKGNNFALTPDGKTLYVADPLHHCVHVIALI